MASTHGFGRFFSFYGAIHPRKRTNVRSNGTVYDYFNRKYIFQPLIFRGHVSFPGSKSNLPKSRASFGRGLRNLLGGGFKYFFIFTPIWGRFPN